MNYEVLYIIPAKYSETEIEELNKKVPAVLEELGATVIRIDNWGKRKLAYHIKHFRYGYYTLIIFSAPGEVLEKITQRLNLNQDIVRFQIVKEVVQGKRKSVTVQGDDFMVNSGEPKEKKSEKPKSTYKPAPVKAKEEVKVKEVEIKEEKPVKEKKVKEEKTEEEKPKKKAEKKKAGIDQLDEKLDELLNEAI